MTVTIIVYFRFFLDVLHNQKTTKLEWIIIILIAAEMVIGLCGLVMNYKALYPNTNSGNTEEDHTEKKVRILH